MSTEPSDQLPEERRPVGLFRRFVAVFLWVIGTFLLTYTAMVIVAELPPGHISHAVRLFVFLLIVPTMGMSFFLLGIDLWRGSQRLAWLSAILLAPFLLCMAFAVVMLICTWLSGTLWPN